MPVTSTGMTNGVVEPSDEIKPDSRGLDPRIHAFSGSAQAGLPPRPGLKGGKRKTMRGDSVAPAPPIPFSPVPCPVREDQGGEDEPRTEGRL
jgi:hypothetical protein